MLFLFSKLLLTFPPSIGDVLDLLIALFIIKRAGKIDGGPPKTLYARMMWNIMFDFGIGLIPLVGDIADAFYRANTRNAWLLDAYSKMGRLTKNMFCLSGCARESSFIAFAV